jgi:hypothetical protein
MDRGEVQVTRQDGSIAEIQKPCARGHRIVRPLEERNYVLTEKQEPYEGRLSRTVL